MAAEAVSGNWTIALSRLADFNDAAWGKIAANPSQKGAASGRIHSFGSRFDGPGSGNSCLACFGSA
jgi:hypothetical protein